MKTKKEVILLKAIADNVRFSIIDLLIQQKSKIKEGQKDGIYVSQLKKKLNIEPTLLSHHLSTLLKAGLVKSTREGKTVCYSLNSKIKGKEIKLGKLTLLW